MNELKAAILSSVKTDFDWKIYGLTALLLGIALFINYSSLVDLHLFDLRGGFYPRLGYYGLLFGGTYFLTALLAASGAKKAYLKDWRFWVLGLCFVAIATIPKLHTLKLVNVRAHGWSLPEMVFVSKCHFFVHQMVISLVALGAIKLLFHRYAPISYGFNAGWHTLKPYLYVLLLVAPLVVVASFFPAFQSAYPQYKPWNYPEVFNLSLWQQTAIFEPSYATGFIAVEAIFRGALAITMVKIMGSRAIIAMAAFYCVFHFGKPAGEAIGAFFGGYALGVLAVHSNSMVGGLIVHLGVAMLMEAMGYLHYYV